MVGIAPLELDSLADASLSDAVLLSLLVVPIVVSVVTVVDSVPGVVALVSAVVSAEAVCDIAVVSGDVAEVEGPEPPVLPDPSPSAVASAPPPSSPPQADIHARYATTIDRFTRPA